MKRSDAHRWRHCVSPGLGTALAALATVALAAVPARQQARVMSSHGGPEVLQLQTVPVLAPGAGQVLLRVYAASINPIVWKIRGSHAHAGGPPGSAMILGLDDAGIIETVGSGVSVFKPGDTVFATLDMSAGSALNGGYSQFVVAAVDRVVSNLATLTFAAAAGLGVAGVTALRAVMETHVAAGERVLVTGVAGGVGSAAAQIARARGAQVLGTASARHRAYLQGLGVEPVIDYTSGHFEDRVHDLNVVIDTVGADTSVRALKTLKKGGRFTAVAAKVSAQQCG